MHKRDPEDLKDSGIEWIGGIPNAWNVSKLKYLARIISGQSPASESYNKNGHGTPFLQGNADFTDLYPIGDTYTNAGKKYSQRNDILFSVRAPVGELNISDKRYSIGRGLCAIRPMSVDQKFLWYDLQLAREDLRSISTGSTFESVSTEDLKNVFTVAPPIEEQKAIATFLDHKTQAIDQLIEKKQQLIEKLKEKRQALITQAVTKGLNPDAPMKDSGIEWLGEIPKDWEVVRLRYLGKIDTGNKDTQDSVEEGQFPFFVRSDTIEKLDTYSFDTEAVMTSGDGAGVCKIYHHFEGKFALHQRMYAVYDFNNVLGKYVYYSMKANFEKEVLKLSAKSTVESLRMPMLKNFPVVLCPIEEQKRIIDFIENESKRIDDVIDKIGSQLGMLKEYRQSLISAAVTGKIDVREQMHLEN